MRPTVPSTLSGPLASTTESGDPCAASIREGDGDRDECRTSFLADLHELLQRTSRVAIQAPDYGDGEMGCRGWGRTSVCRRMANVTPYSAVLHLSGADELRFRHSLWKAACGLDLAEQFLRREHDVVAGVRSWLRSHSDWLLIVDDMADMALVAPLLREVEGGHVIVVPLTREKGGLDSTWSAITIPPLTVDEAAGLLSSRSGQDVATSEAAAWSSGLRGNPLALNMAASLLRCGASTALAALPACEAAPVAHVVSHAIEHLRMSSPGALNLLTSLIHFSSEPIDEAQMQTLNPLAGTDCWSALRNIGFLRPESADGRTISIPAAVSDACRRSLSLESDLLTRGLGLAVEHLPAAPQRTPLADFALGRESARVDAWVCHRATLADHVARSGHVSEFERRLLRDSAGDALTLGAVASSISKFELLREIAGRETAGDASKDPAETNALGQALEENAAALIAGQRYQEARRMLRQATEKGTQSPVRIASILLAITELDLYENRLERAASRLPLAREWCGHLPIEHQLDGAARLAFLAAATALGQGRLPDARIHLAECRRLRESQSPEPDHAEMQRLRMLEARVAFLHKDDSESERILREDLRILGESRSASESQRIIPLSLLADLLYLTGQSDEALPVYERLLTARRALCGTGHRLVAEAGNRLAVLLSQRGRSRDAEPLFAESLAATSQAMGAGHPEVARVLNDYAEFLHSRGRYEEAETHLRRALGIQERALRVTDPRIARTRNNLAAVHVGRRQFAAAERLYREDVLLKRHGKGGRSTLATALNNLGETLRRQGKWSEAEAALREALEIRMEDLGETHPHVAQSCSNLAGLYVASGDLSKARSQAERALALRRATFETSHPSIGISLQLLAEVAIREGRSRDAHAPLLEACDIFAATPDSPHLGGALLAAGQNALRLRKRGRGELLIRRAIDILARTHGTKNPVHARALVALAELQIASRQGDAAQKLLESAMPALQGAAAPAEFRRELGEALLRLGTILSPDQACRMIGLALPFLNDSPKGTDDAAGIDDPTNASFVRRPAPPSREREPEVCLEAAAAESMAVESRVTESEPTLCGSVFDDF